jgi:hypothetical protein
VWWDDRERVAESVFDVLEPGGNIALVAHTVEGRQKPPGPVLPKIPHTAIRSLVEKYLGPRPRAGLGFAGPATDRWEDALERTRFGRGRQVFAPGRPDIVQDVDGVVANYLSMSFAAPQLSATGSMSLWLRRARSWPRAPLRVASGIGRETPRS